MTEHDATPIPPEAIEKDPRFYEKLLIAIDGDTEHIIRRTIVNKKAHTQAQLTEISEAVPGKVRIYLAIDAEAAKAGLGNSPLRQGVLYSLELICSAYQLPELHECLRRISGESDEETPSSEDQIKQDLERIIKSGHYTSTSPSGPEMLNELLKRQINVQED